MDIVIDQNQHISFTAPSQDSEWVASRLDTESMQEQAKLGKREP